MTASNHTGAAGIGRPSSLPELLDALAELPTLPPVERARRARAIANRDAKSVLAAVADAAVVEATRGQTYAEVAEALGVSESAIKKAVIRHNARERSAR